MRPSVVRIVTREKAVAVWPAEGDEEEMENEAAPGEGVGPTPEVQGLGSGVIVDGAGYILTNNHVVAQAEKIIVFLDDDTEYPAELVGTDSKTDLAVIKIVAKDLVAAKLGDSEALEVGEWVLAYGAPFNLAQSVSAGIVSAKGRSHVGVINHAFSYENFIQTDAAINRGNSGGPLVNMKGEVIGINTAIVTGNGGYQGVGFAIPSNTCKKVMEDIIKYKRVVRGYLGVKIEDVTAEQMAALKLPAKEGVYVSDVFANTPADTAGLKKGDVIMGIGDKKTLKVEELRAVVAESQIGQKAVLKVLRAGKVVTLEVTIAEQPDTEIAALAVLTANWHDDELGMTLQTLEPAVARILTVEGEAGVYAGDKGVLVVAVDEGSLAAKSGIKPNDLIRQVANEGVTTLEEYRKIRGKTETNKGVLLFVKSGRKSGLKTVK